LQQAVSVSIYESVCAQHPSRHGELQLFLHLLRINKDWTGPDGLNEKINNTVSLVSRGFYLTEAERGVIA